MPVLAQDSLPYREIPAYPDTFTAETMAARMIDGLGFRYYWATEGLLPDDLAYRPTPEARSCEETIDHILGLSSLILNTVQGLPNNRSGEETVERSFEEKRRTTLVQLKQASENLQQPGINLEELELVFIRGENRIEYPFWNLINGPIADALWHVGQVVSFRRSSGNPFPAGVNVLTGKGRE